MTSDVRQTKSDPSLGQLIAQLSSETTSLVRQELDLAKTEMSQKVSRMGQNMIFLAAGGAVAYAGLLAILAGIVVGISAAGLSLWLSALIVGIVVAAVGGFLVMKGLGAMKQEGLAPRHTIETLKEDVKWAKEQTK